MGSCRRVLSRQQCGRPAPTGDHTRCIKSRQPEAASHVHSRHLPQFFVPEGQATKAQELIPGNQGPANHQVPARTTETSTVPPGLKMIDSISPGDESPG